MQQIPAARGGNRVLRRVLPSFLSVPLMVIAIAVSPAITRAAQGDLPWMNTSLTPEQRADLLIDAMTLNKKLKQLNTEPINNKDLDVDAPPNTKTPPRLDCDFTPVGRHIEGIPELAIPDFRMAN